MTRRLAALAGAAIVSVAVNLVGVIYFFRPIAEGDSAPDAPPPAAVGFLVYVLLSVGLLDWASRRFGHPVRVALLAALAQIVLIVDLVLRGERGVATGAAGSVLTLATWLAMGFVYDRVRGG